MLGVVITEIVLFSLVRVSLATNRLRAFSTAQLLATVVTLAAAAVMLPTLGLLAIPLCSMCATASFIGPACVCEASASGRLAVGFVVRRVLVPTAVIAGSCLSFCHLLSPVPFPLAVLLSATLTFLLSSTTMAVVVLNSDERQFWRRAAYRLAVRLKPHPRAV